MVRKRAPGFEEQRDMILDHAARLFAVQGYHRTSMNEVADACSMSKATLYHYFRDKYALLIYIAEGHMIRLESLIAEVRAANMPAREALAALIHGFVREYAGAQYEHRVLTDDVRFLNVEDRSRILERQRRVVSAFAEVICELRPDLSRTALQKPLTMLLMGMINWMFTWFRPDGRINYAEIAPLVSAMFFGGLDNLPAAFDPAGNRAEDNAQQQVHHDITM